MSASQDPYRYFRVEAREILDDLGRGVLLLESGAPPGHVTRLLRLAHTLKGAARVVRQPGIAEQAHAVEDALEPRREQAAPLPRPQIDHLLQLIDAASAQLAGLEPRAEAGPAPQAVVAPLRTVRADIAEMDRLLDGVAEARVQLQALRRAIGGAGQLDAGLELALADGIDRADHEMQLVRDAALRLRLVPAGAMFATLERAVHDASGALGKQAAFTAAGGGIRLDAHVLEVIQGALLQIVRNALAHGIETPAKRREAGKPPAGRVTLEVVRRGNRVAFVCRDDGGGIDLEAVRRVARERGLAASEIQGLGVQALLQLLLGSGFTTASAVTELSGRGIGLDVVREAASQLGGTLRVDTEAGRGTSLELLVPLSLSSLEALLVEAGGMVAAIPLDAVRRTLLLAPDDLSRNAEGASIVHEGKAIGFAPLAAALCPGAAPGRPVGGSPAVVVGGAAAPVAVGADRLLGIATVVVRPLPCLAPADPVVAGAFLDADGNPQLVLDPDGLVAHVLNGGRMAAPREGDPGSPVSGSSLGLSPGPILVIDDSLTTRMLEQSILESAGYDVDLAVSAEDGLEKAVRRQYRLFLVDVEMPGMDGFSFIETIRADPALCRIPAVLVTSRGTPADRRRGVEAGASGHIVKSEFDQSEVLATIRRLLAAA